MLKACDIHCTVYDFSIHMLHHNHRLLDWEHSLIFKVGWEINYQISKEVRLHHVKQVVRLDEAMLASRTASVI